MGSAWMSLTMQSSRFFWNLNSSLVVYLTVKEEHGVGMYEPDHAEQQVLLEPGLLVGVLVELHRLDTTENNRILGWKKVFSERSEPPRVRTVSVSKTISGKMSYRVFYSLTDSGYRYLLVHKQ